MGHALKRMAYTPAAQQVEDLGGGLFTVDGREICESDTTPMHIGSIPAYIRGFMRRLEGNVEPGDIIIHNNPYHGASHSPDLCVAIPIFWEGELIAWSASTIHLSDTGGVFPGIAIDVHDVWAESKIYDSLKLYERGVRNEQLWQFFIDNTRTPSYVVGDTEAMIAAGQARREALPRAARAATAATRCMSAVEEFLDYCERMMRAQIEAVPDGTWEAEGWLDDDGRNRGEPLYVHTKVTVEGSDITVDLSKSCDNVATGFNVPFGGSVLPGIYTVIRSVFLDEATFDGLHPAERRDLPADQGHRARGQHLQPAVPALGAVARVPDPARVRRRDPGAGGGRARPRRRRVEPPSASASTPATSRRSREYWVHVEINEGAYGGRLRQGRHRRDRRAHGQLAQHADRGDRLAVPDAHRALRAARRRAGAGAVARRHRDHPREPLPRGTARSRRRPTVPTRRRRACSAAGRGARCGLPDRP